MIFKNFRQKSSKNCVTFRGRFVGNGSNFYYFF